ncbi:hypothetical protein [Neptuniibacter sp. QD37_11]|uniref:hypothetical protein n=1 Tax=Neptuniibacter sp. QD37_11 TaxID=3398209 RepID=UPI0039F5BE7A
MEEAGFVWDVTSFGIGVMTATLLLGWLIMKQQAAAMRHTGEVMRLQIDIANLRLAYSLLQEVNKSGKTKTASISKQFDEEDLQTLVRLCHPDKHCGKKSAVEMTQKLNGLLGK